jgi:hypothetical protein
MEMGTWVSKLGECERRSRISTRSLELGAAGAIGKLATAL